MIEIYEAPLNAVWAIRQSVMYPEEALDFVKLDDDADGKHYGLYMDDRLVSVVSLFERGDEVQFRKFATITGLQGQGFGSRLLAFVMQWAEDKQMRRIWCNARLSSTGIYEKFGMRSNGERWTKYGIDFTIMEKQLR